MARIPIGQCTHAANLPQITTFTTVCAECGVGHPTRVCLTCGYVGCCESLAGHATAHAKSAGHPVIRELPVSEKSFTWCYECNAYLDV
jgi:uncharacterized UBP type Zn finger protein